MKLVLHSATPRVIAEALRAAAATAEAAPDEADPSTAAIAWDVRRPLAAELRRDVVRLHVPGLDVVSSKMRLQGLLRGTGVAPEPVDVDEEIDGAGGWAIVKPAEACGGRGIVLVPVAQYVADHQHMMQRTGRKAMPRPLVQRYIEWPLCVHGYKVDARVYVVLVFKQGQATAWIYRDGLARVCTQTYHLPEADHAKKEEAIDLRVHLTNTSLQRRVAAPDDLTRLATDLAGALGPIISPPRWPLTRLLRHIETTQPGATAEHVWHGVDNIVRVLLQRLQETRAVPEEVAQSGCTTYEFLGLDVLLQEDVLHQPPLLLEVNAPPAMHVDGETDELVKKPLARDLADLLVDIARQASSESPTFSRTHGLFHPLGQQP